ncbi:MAG: glycosyltransferase [Caldilineaceae bacterium]|nr:glycosyltransferase [Caldilineaceae bacterium]
MHMYTLAVWLLQIVYAVGVVGLALYGFQALWLTVWQRRSPEIQPDGFVPAASDWPRVTVQLPIYNERHVVGRLIEACAKLDYPADKLQIQVLDDSTDGTAALSSRFASEWRRKGVRVEVVHRRQRSGYKAGALAHALPQASGEYIALFDADFRPSPDFLRRMIPAFLGAENRRIGFVQARWAHLNRDYSPLTSSQALALDGHFVVEQAGRQAAGYAFGFNGSAGVWRRSCIEDPAVGGWQADTLCEDLDLSYRAQLAGWHPSYLNAIEAPAEVPPQLIAFKRQQFRWAKGSVQTLRKLAARVWRSPWPLTKRVAALAHMGNYLIHPLLIVLLLAILPLTLLGADPFKPLAYLSILSLGPPLLYAFAQRDLHPNRWLRNWLYLPMLMLLGTGLCLNNSIAVVQGLRGQGGQFLRTPKFHVESSGDQWQQSAYKLPIQPMVFGELALAIYALATTAVVIGLGRCGPHRFCSSMRPASD